MSRTNMHGMRKDKLILASHDPSWVEEFEAERIRILSNISDSAVVIEHVGSTAIPTVLAKPILDIAILCGESGIEPVQNGLTDLGYEYRGAYGDQEGHYYAVLDHGLVRMCQAHIYTKVTSDWLIKLKFRDVLRKNSELANEYSQYKQELARIALNKREYAETKSRWVDNFIVKVCNRGGA